MMDDRTERIGAHAPVSCLPWAVNALGPEDPIGPELAAAAWTRASIQVALSRYK
jgi:hypothetical protein